MIAAILLVSLFGAPKAPSIEALVAHERNASSLPCGIDDELYVPDEGELAYMKEEAAAVLGRAPSFHQLRVTIVARGIIRRSIGKRKNLSCGDIIGIHDAALERAEEQVTASEPVRRTSGRSRPQALEQMLRSSPATSTPEIQRDSN